MRRTPEEHLLFNDGLMFDALRANLDTVHSRVQKVAESMLRARPEAELIDELVDELKIRPLELDEDGRRMTKQEVQVDVSRDPRRAFFNDGGQILVPGIRVIVTLPFRGNPDLWQIQPSTFTTSPPRGNISISGDRASGALEMVFEQPADEPVENIKASLDRRMEGIRFYTSHQRNDLRGHEEQLRVRLASAITARRTLLVKHDDLSSLLGIQEVKSGVPLVPGSGSFRPQKEKSSPSDAHEPENEVWDVFVSHASEDKDAIARPLVAALQAEGLRVWFDEMTLKVGDSLRRSIDRGLAKSRFGVVVVSKAFLSKEWPQRELDGLVAREGDGQKVILPIWHEVTAADVRKCSPTLADRLAVPSSRGTAAAVKELMQVIRPE